MHLLKTIKGKFILNLGAAVAAAIVSVIVAYFIATGSIKTIMEEDLDSVADQVGPRMKVRRSVPLEDRNGKAFQVEAHRRVDILVGAGHRIAFVFEHACQRGHPRAADAHEVNMPDSRGDPVVFRLKNRRILRLSFHKIKIAISSVR